MTWGALFIFADFAGRLSWLAARFFVGRRPPLCWSAARLSLGRAPASWSAARRFVGRRPSLRWSAPVASLVGARRFVGWPPVSLLVGARLSGRPRRRPPASLGRPSVSLLAGQERRATGRPSFLAGRLSLCQSAARCFVGRRPPSAVRLLVGRPAAGWPPHIGGGEKRCAVAPSFALVAQSVAPLWSYFSGENFGSFFW